MTPTMRSAHVKIFSVKIEPNFSLFGNMGGASLDSWPGLLLFSFSTKYDSLSTTDDNWLSVDAGLNVKTNLTDHLST